MKHLNNSLLAGPKTVTQTVWETPRETDFYERKNFNVSLQDGRGRCLSVSGLVTKPVSPTSSVVVTLVFSDQADSVVSRCILRLLQLWKSRKTFTYWEESSVRFGHKMDSWEDVNQSIRTTKNWQCMLKVVLISLCLMLTTQLHETYLHSQVAHSSGR